MGEPRQSIIRVAVAIGIALLFWSVSSSLEPIAKALTRLADAEEPRAAGTRRRAAARMAARGRGAD